MNPESVPQIQLHHWLGAIPQEGRRVRFCVWAPTHDQVVVDLVDHDRKVIMDKTPGGFHVAIVDQCAAGDRYFYRVDGGPPRPDPASRFQGEGVHGPSSVVARDFEWTDDHWRGVDRDDLIVYESHIGALTQPGTFAAAIDRLDELVELGITAIEWMPLAASAGRWNWGYDGVNWFAPLASYGTPDDLRRLVNAAHSRGLSVILDVVYNHLGPEGNYLAEFGPYLSDRHQTVWGAGPNFDDPVYGAQLRRFVIANALMWFDEYHIDGLRVDAIHCMRDDSDPHVAVDISRATKAWSAQSGRTAMLIAESNVYDEAMVRPIDEGGVGFDAEWCDDFLHSLFAVLRPGEQLCHRIYEQQDLKQTLEIGYVYEGSFAGERARRPREHRVDTRSLVYSIQHHDFIGNHPLGKRLHQVTSKPAQRAAIAKLLLSPAIPMLFMGEEFCCEHPFQFFVDFGDEALRQAVVQGRKREYPQHDWSGGVLPTDPAAFQRSKIGRAEDGDLAMRQWYGRLIELRKQWRQSGLLRDANLQVTTDTNRGFYVLQYASPQATGTVVVRLSPHNDSAVEAETIAYPDSLSAPTGDCILDSQVDTDVQAWLPNHARIFFTQSPVS
ncbi:MAG: malto-oligosyltrehalose trehalohydrolase [Pirellulaceae bacterium]|nr:malto-oligosyltrehalose trehalohydrolase [Pirellulaceae bacterium]